MDYEVTYKVNDEIKIEVVSFDDFIVIDFLQDFVLDKLEYLEEVSDIEIIHIENLRDYEVDVYQL